jgi:hypothetical protein
MDPFLVCRVSTDCIFFAWPKLESARVIYISKSVGITIECRDVRTRLVSVTSTE